jgi:Type I phosphodiesterase / nucleotide pyrophosphatase
MMSSPSAVAAFAPPRFDGKSLLNFAATLEAALGQTPAYPLLADARLRERLLGARHLVVWVIDGLGVEPLRTLAPDSVLSQAVCGEVDALFPSSTAPTLTTLITARAPAVHAVPEWFLWLDECNAVYRSLPLDARDPASGKPPIDDASALYPQRSLMTRARRPCHAVMPAYIAQSAYSRYAHEGATTLPFAGEDAFIAAITSAIDVCRDGAYVYAYVDRFDQVAHEFGVASDKANAIVRRLDRWFERLSAELSARGALLVVTADHGFIDAPASLRLHLEAFPPIAECLQRPLCGGPRTPFAYVKPERHEDFVEVVAQNLGEHFVAVPSAELVAAGWFGPDVPEPRLHARLGTHILLPKDEAYLVDRLPGERSTPLIGIHGGMTRAECRVPLILAGAENG